MLKMVFFLKKLSNTSNYNNSRILEFQDRQLQCSNHVSQQLFFNIVGAFISFYSILRDFPKTNSSSRIMLDGPIGHYK